MITCFSLYLCHSFNHFLLKQQNFGCLFNTAQTLNIFCPYSTWFSQIFFSFCFKNLPDKRFCAINIRKCDDVFVSQNFSSVVLFFAFLPFSTKILLKSREVKLHSASVFIRGAQPVAVRPHDVFDKHSRSRAHVNISYGDRAMKRHCLLYEDT